MEQIISKDKDTLIFRSHREAIVLIILQTISPRLGGREAMKQLTDFLPLKGATSRFAHLEKLSL